MPLLSAFLWGSNVHLLWIQAGAAGHPEGNHPGRILVGSLEHSLALFMHSSCHCHGFVELLENTGHSIQQDSLQAPSRTNNSILQLYSLACKLHGPPCYGFVKLSDAMQPGLDIILSSLHVKRYLQRQ